MAVTPLLMVAAPGSTRLAVAVTVTVSLTPWMDRVALTKVSVDNCTCAVRVTVCMPDSVNVTVYVPGGNADNR